MYMRARRKLFPAPFYLYSFSRVHCKSARQRDDVMSLAHRLIAQPGIGIASLSRNTAILETLTGGRSAAQVFKLTPLFGTGRRATKGKPVVVKIAPRADAVRERANYERFVRAGLPAACRPALLGFAAAGERGALCYAFVGGRDGARRETLTDHLQRGDGAALDLVLRRIFAPLRRTWYGADMIRGGGDLARRYLDRYFAGLRGAAKNEAVLAACAARYFKAKRKDGGYAIGADWFPSPTTVLFTAKRKRRHHTCILHGDLNTDNIVVAKDRKRVTLIDFQKTGRGHVYQDLVSLEASVRINHPRDATFAEIVEIERRIAQGGLSGHGLSGRGLSGRGLSGPALSRQEAAQKIAHKATSRKAGAGEMPDSAAYSLAIRKVRAAAFRTFGAIEGESNYHFAVAVIALRLMQATDLTPIARARITMSALWAAKMLAEERG